MLKKFYSLTKALVGRGVSLLGALLLALTIARVVGAEGLGTFAICQAALNILSVIGRAGYDRTVTRYIGGLAAPEVAARKLSIRRVMRNLFLLNIAAGALVYAISSPALKTTQYTSILEIWPIFCALIPVYALTMIINGYFRGIKKPGTSALMEAGASSFTASIAIGALLIFDIDVSLFFISIIFATSSCITLIYGLVIFHLSFEQLSPADSKHETSFHVADFRLEASLPFMLITLIPFINQFVPLLSSGIILSPADAGIFRVSERATLILSAPLLIISSILPPYILELHRAGKISQIRQLNAKISFWTTSIGSVILLICILYRTDIVVFFGSEFTEAGSIFAIMAIGQFINLAAGPVSLTLMMIGKERQVRDVNIAMMLSGITLYPVAFTAGGAIGAACIYSAILADRKSVV